MHSSGISLAVCVAFALVLTAYSGEVTKPRPSGLDRFTRAELLHRFDRDGDKTLSAAERDDVRTAFGGIDVPMLPDQPNAYAELTLPAHLESVLATDNTPADNPLTDAGASLGRVLFYDRQLSANNTIACGSCHSQQLGFSDPRRFSVGFEGGKTGRNAMGLANLRFSNIRGSRPGFFWDERAATLEEQALMPIQDALEMGMTLGRLVEKLGQLPYYPPLFQRAFGTPEINSDRVAKAIAQFMRSMISFDAKFDRAVEAAHGDYSRDFEIFTDEENLGKTLFIDGVAGVGEIGCAHCHMPPTFGMPKSFNNGLDLVYTDQGLGARDLPPNDPFTPTNDGKFKAPSLRNIALTAPYMHDGRFETLQQVVEHYSSGVHPHPNVGLALNETPAGDQDGTGFHLTTRQKQALVAFLKTLTDETLLSDPKFSDPFLR